MYDHRLRVIPRYALAIALVVSAVTGGTTVTSAEAAVSPGQDPAAAVNPLIGTSGSGNTFPGADVPFGMVQWSPDTPSRPSGGGYAYGDTSLTGFSLTHISGPGCGAAGDVPVLPISGAFPASPDGATLPLSHDGEHATAGRYEIAAGGITTALTATSRSGMARFTFPRGSQSNLLFKLSSSANGTTSTHFQVVSPTEVAGWVTSGRFCGAANKYNVFFDMEFDTPFGSFGTYQKGSSQRQGAVTRDLEPSATAPRPPVSGVDGAYLTFDTSTHPTVQAKVGVSYVSTANAKTNRQAENPGWDFEKVATAAHKQWTNQLSKIQVTGGTEAERTVFETALYHALLHPNIYSDSNGQYMGFDGRPHTTPQGRVEYANISGWDTYRTQVQLAALMAPEQTSDLVRSMLDQYDQTGQLPKWEQNNTETYVMVGDPAASIIASAYAFGARNFDTKHALQAMLAEANRPNKVRPGLNEYLHRGYIPVNGNYDCCNFYGAVSTQQEYNTADYAISAFARALGDTDTAATFARRANNWQNVFNPATGYLQARNKDGRFAPGFTPDTYTGFVEATSAQYTPMIPFNVAGIAAAAGGNASWVTRLDNLLSQVRHPGTRNADLRNEPSFLTPWEYDTVGAPAKTQAAVRRIQQELFSTAPDGLPGNDDLGTTSSWYVFSALGFYPQTPGTATLALGSAVFPEAVLHLPSGKLLTISAKNASAATPYLATMTVDGTPWHHAFLPSRLVAEGGAVHEELSKVANPHFGSNPAADAPPSDTTGLAPALGYTAENQLVVEPNGSDSLTVGALNLRGTQQTVSWSIPESTGLTVSPSSGTLVLGAHAKATSSVTVRAATSRGRHPLKISFRSGSGAEMPTVTTEIDIAVSGALWPYFNNAGISSDAAKGPADFDGYGWAYSAQQLAAAGAGRAATVTARGLTFHMPDTAPGDLDNIMAAGQTIPVNAPGVTRIGFLGSASGVLPGARSKATVHFSNGEEQTVLLELTDWTIGSGKTLKPSYGNAIAVATAHRNGNDGSSQAIRTYLFETDHPLSAKRNITSVTLFAPTTGGRLHVFDIAAS